MLCLRGKSLPEPSQGARHRLQAGHVLAPGVSSTARSPGMALRSPSAPECSDAHLCRWAPANKSFPRAALHPTASVGIRQGRPWGVGSIPGHCPVVSAFPEIYPWQSGASHLWKGEMPQRPGSIPPSTHSGAATPTGCSGRSPSTLQFIVLSCCKHVQNWDNQKLATAQPSLKSTAQV